MAEDLDGDWAGAGGASDGDDDVRGSLLADSIDATGADGGSSDDDGGADFEAVGSKRKPAAALQTIGDNDEEDDAPAPSAAKKQKTAAPSKAASAKAPAKAPAKLQAKPQAVAAGDDDDEDPAPATASASGSGSSSGSGGGVVTAEEEKKRRKKEKLAALKAKKKLAKQNGEQKAGATPTATAAAAAGGAGKGGAVKGGKPMSAAEALAAADDTKQQTKAAKKAGKERERVNALCYSGADEQASAISELYDAYLAEQKLSLTAMERDEAGALTAAHVALIPNYATAVSHELKKLPEAVKALMAGWKHALCSRSVAGVVGAPIVLFVTHSTPRSLDIHQSFKALDKQMCVQKLISKRQKPEEQAQALGSADVRVIVGTPQRIGKLADMAALHLHRLTHIFVDSSKDAKGFSMFTIDDVRRDFFALFHKYLRPIVVAGKAKLCLF